MAYYYKIQFEDFDLELLDPHNRNMEKNALIAAITLYYQDYYHLILDKLSIAVTEEEISISFEPDELEAKDNETFGRAVALLSERKLNMGREYLLKLLEKYPLNGDLLYNLGMSYSEEGKLKESLNPLLKAVQVKPFFSNAYVALGFTHAKMGQLEESVKYNKLAVMYDKYNYHAYRNLAGCLLQLKRLEEARKFIEKSLQLEPSNPQSLYGYALLLKDLGDINGYTSTLKKIVSNGIDDRMINVAKRELSKMADEELKERYADGTICMLSALRLFKGMDKNRIAIIAAKAAQIGLNGVDIDNITPKYYFQELGKNCTGLELLCYMYAGFQIFDPKVEVGIDLSKEYKAALELMNKGIE